MVGKVAFLIGFISLVASVTWHKKNVLPSPVGRLVCDRVHWAEVDAGPHKKGDVVYHRIVDTRGRETWLSKDCVLRVYKK